MDISKPIGLTILLALAWMAFAYNLITWTRASPPKANVVPSSNLAPVLTEAAIASADLSLPFATKESFEQEMAEFHRWQITRIAMAGLFGAATVIIGTLLERNLAFGLLCLLVGPVRAIYIQYSEAR